MNRLFFLLLLLFACVIGYLIHKGEFRFILDDLRPNRESDIPVEFRGNYVADVEANLRYIRNNRNFHPKLKKELSRLMEAERLQILRGSMISKNATGDQRVRFGVKVLKRGPNWIEIKNITQADPNGYAIVVRIDKDGDDGIWFSSESPLKGFKQRFKRVD